MSTFAIFVCPSSDLTSSVYGGNTRTLGSSKILGPGTMLGKGHDSTDNLSQAATLSYSVNLTAGIQYFIGLAGEGYSIPLFPGTAHNYATVYSPFTTNVTVRKK